LIFGSQPSASDFWLPKGFQGRSPWLVFNTPGLSAGIEVTLVFGGPSDLAGPYFGISVGVTLVAGIGGGVTGTVLFSPTFAGTTITSFTLMGVALNFSASTGFKLPVTVSLEMTNTRISRISGF
jgi:hypothetical protein